MTLVATAVLPTPVFLLPGMTGSGAAEPDLRAACLDALKVVCASAEAVCVIADRYEIGTPRPPGAGHRGRQWQPTLGHRLARALLEDVGWAGSAGDVATRGTTREITTSCLDDARTCAGLWASETALRGDAATALVVMGDLSACSTPDSPTWYDPAAAAFDLAVQRALLSGDPEALLTLDPQAGRDFLVSGRAPWQVMAGAWLSASGRPDSGGGARRTATIHWSGSPFGVGYRVVTYREPCESD